MEKRSTHSCWVFTDQYWRSSSSNPSWHTSSATYGLLNDVNAVYGSAGASWASPNPFAKGLNLTFSFFFFFPPIGLGGWSFTIKGGRTNKYNSQAQLNNMLTDFSNFASSSSNVGTFLLCPASVFFFSSPTY